MNLALDKINQGRFFLKTAAAIGFTNLDNFRYCVEASIVANRSVTFLLQKQYSSMPGFEEWYNGIQNDLKERPLSKFLLNKRNFILKQGTADIKIVTYVSLSEVIEIDEAININVIGGAWKSRLKNSLLNFKNSFQFKWKGWKQQFFKKKRKLAKSSSQSYQACYFAEPEWSDKPAIELIYFHLDYLESIVNACINKFGDGKIE